MSFDVVQKYIWLIIMNKLMCDPYIWVETFKSRSEVVTNKGFTQGWTAKVYLGRHSDHLFLN